MPQEVLSKVQVALAAGLNLGNGLRFSHVFSFQSAVIFQESTDSFEAVLAWSSQTAMPFQGTAKNGPWC